VTTEANLLPSAEAIANVRYHADHNFPHPSKAVEERLVTLFGIVTLVSPLQPENALSPMYVTPSGIVTLVSPLQPENALSPMYVTPSGIVTLVKPLQSTNA
jgi:hypothetical protein